MRALGLDAKQALGSRFLGDQNARPGSLQRGPYRGDLASSACRNDDLANAPQILEVFVITKLNNLFRILPSKADVRRRTGIVAGDEVTITLELL